MIHELLHHALAYLSQAPSPTNPNQCPPVPPGQPDFCIPNIAPIQPGWAPKLVELVGNIRWLSGLAIVAIFFIGLIVWSAGRGIDHHRAGRTGTVMMLTGVFGALAWALGYTLISTLAS